MGRIDRKSAKREIYDTVSAVGQALASGHRLEILDLLCQGEIGVDELASKVGLSVKLTSAHLRTLRGAKLVETRREGKHVIYRIASPNVVLLLVQMRALAEERFQEIEHFLDALASGSDFATMDRDTLLKRVRSGEVVLIDVRPPAEHEAGHIPASQNIPLKEIERRLSDFPRSKEIVAYCRGPYCVLSHEAVAVLRANGFNAHVLRDGVAEWQAAGLPIAAGAESKG